MKTLSRLLIVLAATPVQAGFLSRGLRTTMARPAAAHHSATMVAPTSLAPAVGAVVAVQHVCTKLPKLRKLAAAPTTSNAASRSPAAAYGNVAVYATRVAYHCRSGYPLTAWLELPLLIVYNSACIAVLRRQRGDSSDGRSGSRLARDLAATAALWLVLARLPLPLLRWLNLGAAPLLAASYYRQALAVYRSRSTGELRSRAVLRRLARSLARAFTTTAQLGGDTAVLLHHVLGAIGCSTLLAQLSYYRHSTRRATRPLAVPPVPLSGGDRYDYLLAALMWRSLGGFGPEQAPRRISRRKMRAAFQRLDADGDGIVALAELRASLLAARPELDDATAARMLRAADLDGDGLVRFEEFAQIMSVDFEVVS